MNRLSMIVLAALSVIPLACSGGGDGDDGSSCADMAAAINDCMTSVGDDPDPNIQGMCEAITCTGSRQAVIDYVIAHECNEAMPYDSMAEMIDQGCAFPATCTGVAYWLAIAAEQDVTAPIAGGQETTCTGSKSAALACIVALDPLSSDLTDVNDCVTDEGCPPIEID